MQTTTEATETETERVQRLIEIIRTATNELLLITGSPPNNPA